MEVVKLATKDKPLKTMREHFLKITQQIKYNR